MNSSLGTTFNDGQLWLPLLVVAVYSAVFFFLFRFFRSYYSNNRHKINSLFFETVRIVVLRNRKGFRQYRQQRFKSWFESLLTDKQFLIRLLRLGIQACLIVLAMIFLLGLLLSSVS